jgi:hypothetical protein
MPKAEFGKVSGICPVLLMVMFTISPGEYTVLSDVTIRAELF